MQSNEQTWHRGGFSMWEESIAVSLIPYIQISVKTDINDPLSLFNHAVFTQLLLLIETSLFFFFCS